MSALQRMVSAEVLQESLLPPQAENPTETTRDEKRDEEVDPEVTLAPLRDCPPPANTLLKRSDGAREGELFLGDLPNELLIKIFKFVFLPEQDFCSIERLART